jgi:hypothetical protein
MQRRKTIWNERKNTAYPGWHSVMDRRDDEAVWPRRQKHSGHLSIRTNGPEGPQYDGGDASWQQPQHWIDSRDYSTTALLLISVIIKRILVLYLTLLSTYRSLTNGVKDRLPLGLPVRWTCRMECLVCKEILSYILSLSIWKNAKLNHTHFTLLPVQKAPSHIISSFPEPLEKKKVSIFKSNGYCMCA